MICLLKNRGGLMKTVKKFGLHNLRKGIKILFPKKSYIVCTNYEIDVSNESATVFEVDDVGEKKQTTYVLFDNKEISEEYRMFNNECTTSFGNYKYNHNCGTDDYYLLRSKIIEEDL